jgi:CheY-like chemotaxis protein
VAASSGGEGQGSQFVVRLPIVDVVEAPAAVATGAPGTVRGRRVLVVDDNHDAAATLAMLLELAGHQAFSAHDGAAALAAAERHRPDVLLLDIGLPVLNGYEVCRLVREQPWGEAVLIVALTGWGQEEDRERSRLAGFDGHLVKPVDLAALNALLGAREPAANG